MTCRYGILAAEPSLNQHVKTPDQPGPEDLPGCFHGRLILHQTSRIIKRQRCSRPELPKLSDQRTRA
jgi:hypothetical protein